MEMHYQLTEDEYVHAQLGYWTQVRHPNRLRIQTVIATVSVLLGLVAVAMLGLRDNIGGWFILFIGSFLFVDRYLLTPYRLRRMFRLSPNTSSGRQVAISDQGLEIVMPNSSEGLRWGAFQKVHELDDEFLLMYSPVSFVIIPKRVFDSAGLEQFRAVLRAKSLLDGR